MRKQTTDPADELARARLAYVSLGQRPISAPKRAADPTQYIDEQDVPVEQPHAVDVHLEEAPPSQPSDAASEHNQSVAAQSWRARLALSRTHIIALVVLLAVVAITLAISLGKSVATEVSPQPEPSKPAAPSIAQQPPTVTNGAPPPSQPPSQPVAIRVHVTGAVAKPGVVTLPSGAIVQDAIEAAGGLTDAAVPGDLNLAAPVGAGMQVKVGSQGEESHVSAGEQPAGPKASGQSNTGGQGSSAAGSGDNAGGRVNLNTATAEELETLPGIGPVTAAAIIAWREEHGGFTAATELQEITGIGPKTFTKLEPHVTV